MNGSDTLTLNPEVELDSRPELGSYSSRRMTSSTPGSAGTKKKRMFLKRKQPFYKYILAALDGICIAWSITVGVHLQLGPGISFHRIVTIPTIPEILLNIGFTALVLLVLQTQGLYKINVFLSFKSHLKRIIKSVAYCALFLAAVKLSLSYFYLFSDSIRSSLYFFLTGTFMLVGVRLLIFRTVFRVLTLSGAHRRSIILLGVSPTSRKLVENTANDKWSWISVAGFLDNDIPVGTDICRGVTVLGRLDDVEKIVEQRQIAEIVVCIENVSITYILDLLDLCGRSRAMVRIASSAYNVIPGKLIQEKYGDVPVIGVNNFVSTSYLGIPNMKRVFDVIASFGGLVFHAPLLALIALAIKLDSPGPVFYKQIRIGKGGRPFRFYKFRSMRVGADRDHARETKYASLIKGTWASGQSRNPTKIIDESKVTRVGKFIRKTSLDEFPQLFNVLKGDMSLVGPRPCLPYEWKHYDEWHKTRLSVTPGCTGMWQVLGRSEVGFHDMVILDLFYSQNISFHLDMWLMLKTIPVMVFAKGGK